MYFYVDLCIVSYGTVLLKRSKRYFARTVRYSVQVLLPYCTNFSLHQCISWYRTVLSGKGPTGTGMVLVPYVILKE